LKEKTERRIGKGDIKKKFKFRGGPPHAEKKWGRV